MNYFIYKLVLRIIFYFNEIIHPASALPRDYKIIVHPVNPTIHEASGIADSKSHPGFLWVQEDSGNPAEIILLSHQGQVRRKISLPGIKNRDWEDMALVGKEIYIADTGDNSLKYKQYSFYIFEEPAAEMETVNNVKRIKFKYPVGAHDSEAFLVDPVTKDIFIITKRDSLGLIYHLPVPYNNNQVNQVRLAGKLSYTGVVSAAISPNGQDIIIKTYTNLYHYTRTPGENIPATLKKPFKNLPYQIEPQGEAITFALDNSGFFTFSERRFDLKVDLYFYPRQ